MWDSFKSRQRRELKSVVELDGFDEGEREREKERESQRVGRRLGS